MEQPPVTSSEVLVDVNSVSSTYNAVINGNQSINSTNTQRAPNIVQYAFPIRWILFMVPQTAEFEALIPDPSYVPISDDNENLVSVQHVSNLVDQ